MTDGPLDAPAQHDPREPRNGRAQHSGAVSPLTRRLLFWVPRAGLVLFAGFVSLFSLDVLGTGAGVWDTVIGLLIHLIPAVVLLVVVLLAWRRPWLGTVGSAGWAAWYLATFWGRFPASVYVVMAGPPLLVATLFALDWWRTPDA